MQFFQSIENLLRLPLATNHNLGLLYLGSAFFIAFFIYISVERKDGTSTLRSFFRYCFPRHIWTHASSKVDRRYFLVNNTVGVVLMAPFFISSTLVAFGSATVLESIFGVTGPELSVSLSSKIAMAFIAVLASDLGFYLSHFLFHKIGFLWEFHKVHHSAQVLTPVTNHRVHPVQIIVTRSFSGFGVGLVLGVFDYLYAYNMDPITFAGVSIFTFCFLMTTANLSHSHIWWSFGPIFNQVFISPAQHQIHHSCDPAHWGKNLGSGFAIWDKLFGTLYIPKEKEELVLGLGSDEDHEYSSVWQLYMLPFRKAARLVGRKPGLKGFVSRFSDRNLFRRMTIKSHIQEEKLP